MSKQCVPLLWEVMYCTVEERSFSLLSASVSDFRREEHGKENKPELSFPKSSFNKQGKTGSCKNC